MREFNFDGLPGPTHNYSGLSPGNLAATAHEGDTSNPKAAAIQALAKMRRVRDLGVGQALLPPQPRPHVGALRALGFSGSDADVISSCAKVAPALLTKCSSASCMWTANAATLAPSADTADGRLHITPANLSALFHRSLEAQTTTRLFQRIFSDESLFCVHKPLPSVSQFSDEGAANHTRLATQQGAVHLFGWGRLGLEAKSPTRHYPARQTLEASEALARLHTLTGKEKLLWQQHPEGIDAGAFHTDVLAVGNQNVFLVHELAFVELDTLLKEVHRRLGPEFAACVATSEELPVDDAVNSYPFNSQLVTLPDGSMVIVAPKEAENNSNARRYLERVIQELAPVKSVLYVDVNQSMNNGGGPACLRLRVPLTPTQEQRLGARVVLDDPLLKDLEQWVCRHYRDRLRVPDLADPALLTECETALDELTQILDLGSVYDFQL